MMVMAAGPVSMAVSMAMLVIMIAVRGVVSVMMAHGPGLGPVAPVR